MTRPSAVAALALALALAGLAGVPAVGAQGGGADAVACSFPLTVTDATGTEVTVEERPDRIVALGPSAAQQLWAIDTQDRVRGMPVNEYTDYLDDRDGITNVYGEDGQPVQETVVGLEPDLVLAPNIVENDTVESLRRAELTVYRYDEARSVADVTDEIERTGQLVGSFEQAATVSGEMRGRVAAVEAAVDGEDRPRVYYALGGGYTAGPDTFVGDLIATAGGDNIASRAGIDRYDVINSEVVAEADPEVLVVHEGAGVPDDPAIQNSTAVREDDVVRVDANYINQPGPRNVLPLEQMAGGFHPEAMADADGNATETPEPTQCAGAGESGSDGGTGDGDETAGADGAGFTALAAALAALAAGLLAWRVPTRR